MSDLEFIAGSSIRVYAVIQDTHRHEIDPEYTICQIAKSDDTIVASGTMTQESRGVYFYVWNSPDTAVEDAYSVEIVAISGLYRTKVRNFEFNIVRYLHD